MISMRSFDVSERIFDAFRFIETENNVIINDKRAVIIIGRVLSEDPVKISSISDMVHLLLFLLLKIYVTRIVYKQRLKLTTYFFTHIFPTRGLIPEKKYRSGSLKIKCRAATLRLFN